MTARLIEDLRAEAGRIATRAVSLKMAGARDEARKHHAAALALHAAAAALSELTA